MVTRAAGIRFRWWSIFFLLAAAVIAVVIVALAHGPEPRLDIQADRAEILAGGAAAHLTIRSSIPLPSAGLQATLAEGGHSGRIARIYFDDAAWHVTVQS